MQTHPPWHAKFLVPISLIIFGLSSATVAPAAPVPGGTLDPTTVPKYVTPLVIPPVMPKSTASPAPAADYDIAVRQFKQQILPGPAFPATTVWSYGRAEDAIPANFVAPVPLTNGISFNYPAFTVENSSMQPTSVRWINDLVDPTTGIFIPHLFNVDQTLHWANPPNAGCTTMPGMLMPGTDCHTENPAPYTGPVPLVTHVHGAHVQPHSDGYPQAWWLPGTPGTKGIPATYAERGSSFTQANNANTVPGSAYYSYENSQPASTLWYHDHALGMTRLNVYAGPAGFWLIRGGTNDLTTGLPGPAPAGTGDPNFNAAYRATIREIPLVIQDRSFNIDGSLFYPADRSFFDGFTGPYIGNAGYNGPGFVGPSVPGVTPLGPSDMAGIWNPEAFFNTMVVNGTSWPLLEVSPARYRLRLLDGCNSRTLNLSMFVVSSLGADGLAGTADDVLGAEVPFYQIGSEQGFLSKVVMIQTGFATPLPGNGTVPAAVPAASPLKALLMGPAERADVIVDFSAMATGTRIRMINTGPDAPFQGFATMVPADPLTTGQVMDFIVNGTVQASDAATTAPASLILPAEGALGTPSSAAPRRVSLNEMSSAQVCIELDPVTGVMITRFSVPPGDPTFTQTCLATPPLTAGNIVDVAGPRQALLGILSTDALGNLIAVPKMWSDPITETPLLGSTEIWEIYNSTMDAHPIHLHLVRFELVNREDLNAMDLMAGIFTPTGVVSAPQPNEVGFKDTVIAYPGQVTRIKATFDIAGLYVWHCHIVEHEDNEMMRPYTVTGIIAGATSTTPAGTYKAGSVINVTLNFTTPVSSPGLLITLNNTAIINTGALTDVTSFSGSFTVAATGQETPAGQFLDIAGISGTVTDAAGNASSALTIPAGANISSSVAIKIDTTPPVSTATPPSGTFAGSVSVALSANETAAIYYTIDGTTPTTASPVYVSPILLSSPTTTARTVRFFAVDTAGNVEATINSAVYNLHVNDFSGKVTINNGNAFTNSVNATLSLSASDPAGIASYAISTDNVTYLPAVNINPPVKTFSAKNVPVTLPAGNGLKTVYVRFTDGLGVVYPPVSDTITLETVLPSVTFSPQAGTYAGKIMVSLSSPDEPGGVTIYYTLDGSTPTTSSRIYKKPFSIGSPGRTVVVKFFAKDKAGNVGTVQSVTYRFVDRPHMAAFVSINNGAKKTSTANVTLQAFAFVPFGEVGTMSFSNDGINFTQPVPYVKTKALPWALDSHNGRKTVYFRFTTKGTPFAAPVTYTFSDTIVLSYWKFKKH